MQVLFDQGTPVPLRRYLTSHSVSTVFEKGWSAMQNGDLLRTAEQEGFEVLVEPHGLTAVAPLHTLRRAKPSEAYPPPPRLRRVPTFAFIHGFTPVAFCEGG